MHKTDILPELSGRNGWFETNRYKNHNFTSKEELQNSYDYIIVGAGFGGVNAAFRLAENEPQASIALFDALKIGSFSSGKNAGFLIDVPHAIVGDPKFSEDELKWRFRLNRYVIDRMDQIRKKHSLILDWEQRGMHQAAHEQSGLKYLYELSRFLDKFEAPYAWFNQEDTASRLGTSFYFKSLYTPGTVLMNPSEVVRGLATALPSSVAVFEETPIIDIKEGPIPEVLIAGNRSIKAKKIILTMSTFCRHFGVKHASNIAGIHSFGAFTRQLNDSEIKTLGKAEPWGVTSAHPAGATLRYTTTKRLYVRTDITFATHINISPNRLYKSVKLLRRAFDRRFPELKEVGFEYVYGGYIPITRNTMPLFGEVGQNVVCGAVGDGTGVTRASTVGTFLADLVTGRDSEELRYINKNFHPNYIPPEPFRTIGGTARLVWEDFHAKAEV